jgi:hypothetical protein
LVYERAQALKREEDYDSTQWPLPERSRFLRRCRLKDDPYWHAWLLIEPPDIPVGIVTFDWMDWEDIRHGWHLCAAWIAPEYRHKGVLSKRWPGFVSRYGWFTVEHPVSEAMEAFLFKVHHRTGLKGLNDQTPRTCQTPPSS